VCFKYQAFFAGCLLTFFWYKKKYQGHLVFIIGFSAIVLYHIMMYTRFVNDLNMADFFIPSFLRGFALATLYISIGLYVTAGLPIPATLKVVGFILIVRSFLATGITSGLYNYFLYAGTNRHLSGLASAIDANKPLAWQQAGVAAYPKYMLQQASLGTLKELSGNIIIFGIILVALLAVVYAIGKLRKALVANSL